MLRLFVFLSAVVCCNAFCSFEMLPTQDADNKLEGCPDSQGQIHEFDSEWEQGSEICVCVSYGTICCGRFGDISSPPEYPSTPGIIADYFGAFTDTEPEEESTNNDGLYGGLYGDEVSDQNEVAEDESDSTNAPESNDEELNGDEVIDQIEVAEGESDSTNETENNADNEYEDVEGSK